MHDFEIPLANEEVAWIKERVRAYRWTDEPSDASWQYGAGQAYLQRLQRYWLDHYSWRHAVAQLNALPHFRVNVGDGFHLHCVHRRSPNPHAIPLIISHGWPGSILEFTNIIEQLAEPKNPAMPSFHVVAPSLPGYAWSDKPSKPIGPRAAAKMYAALMRGLGYSQYLAQGGDWGSMVSAWLAIDDPACKALHLSGYGLSSHDSAPRTQVERVWQAEIKKRRRNEMAYLALQATKPQSLAFAMMDSPLGTAAWFTEKFRAWGDRDLSMERSVTPPQSSTGEPRREPAHEPGDPPFSMDWLLTNIMIYLTTRTFGTATWMYRGMAQEGGFTMNAGDRVEVPTGVAHYPKDLLAFPPRTMVQRGYNVQYWANMANGGHFPSVEVPQAFVADLQAFAAALGKAEVF